MRRLASLACAVAFVTGGALAVGDAVAHKRASNTRLAARSERLAAALEATAGPARTDAHVVLNGVAMHVAFTTSDEPLEAAAKRTAACDPRDAERATDDGHAVSLEPIGVHRDDAADGSAVAVLCSHRVRGAEERRERLAFLRRAGDHATSTVAITRASALDLATMFPAEGDAPGADPAFVPRPRHAVRTLAASVAESHHDVWMYASSEAPEAASSDFDRRMRDAGWQPTTVPRSEARLYRRGADDIVALFERSADTTRITISRVPFEARSRSTAP